MLFAPKVAIINFEVMNFVKRSTALTNEGKKKRYLAYFKIHIIGSKIIKNGNLISIKNTLKIILHMN